VLWVNVDFGLLLGECFDRNPHTGGCGMQSKDGSIMVTQAPAASKDCGIFRGHELQRNVIATCHRRAQRDGHHAFGEAKCAKALMQERRQLGLGGCVDR
jgi:hypothetical protein